MVRPAIWIAAAATANLPATRGVLMSLRLPCLLLAAASAGCATPCTRITPRVGQADIDGHVAVADSGQPLADNSLDDA